MRHETEIHRVYTEQVEPILTDKYPVVIACEGGALQIIGDAEESDESKELILTTLDADVTCPDCLAAIKS